MTNTLKVGVLLTLLTAALVLLGRAIGGPGGMILAFGFAILTNVVSYWFSDKIVLKMTRARQIGPNDAPQLFALTQDLANRAGVPMPRLYIINDPQPNAFATGRNPKNAAVAVNSGLLDLLSPGEIAGVVAHELAHVKHRDTLTMTIVATLAGAFMTLVEIARWSALFGMGGQNSDEEGGLNPLAMLALMIVGPIAAILVQSAVSRAREFEADKTAAFLTGSPDGLIGALSKLERGAQIVPTHSMAPQNAHLCIVNPLRGLGGLTHLFSTHPPMDKRIAALQALRGQIPVQNSSAWS